VDSRVRDVAWIHLDPYLRTATSGGLLQSRNELCKSITGDADQSNDYQLIITINYKV
jgi:hypothetical protein